MIQATDIDIKEIKDLIAAGNATTQKQIDRLFAATEANTKAIADLTALFTGLRKEVRVGWSEAFAQMAIDEDELETQSNSLL